MGKISRALISVHNKAGLTDFASSLYKLGIEIISTGGTARVLKKAGIKVKEVSEITKFPEILDGRVKTLHPVIEAGILADRGKKDHIKQLKKLGIKPIDLIVVNLYPFEQTINKNAKHPEIIEQIDIGGPTMLRAAAKNYNSVAIVTNPEQYTEILRELRNGSIKPETRERLAAEAFNYIAHYDIIIDNYFQQKFSKEFPQNLNLTGEKVMDLRYGENPFSKAAYYKDSLYAGFLSNFYQFQGKQLSFNNILDLDSVWKIAHEFNKPTACVMKHANPCGVASDKNLAKAYKTALAVDPISAFGGAVGFNRRVDKKTAQELVKTFIEAVIAPDYDKQALRIFLRKKNLRVIKARKIKGRSADLRKVDGGLLIQADFEVPDTKLKTVSKRKPSKDELEAMKYAWNVCKHVKSNAIVFAKKNQVTGIGAGQMSRVDAVKIAAIKAGKNSKNSAMASDAFFPFRDAVDEAAKAGITAVIQPGGSIRDKEIVKSIDGHGMSMVLTGIRCFLH